MSSFQLFAFTFNWTCTSLGLFLTLGLDLAYRSFKLLHPCSILSRTRIILGFPLLPLFLIVLIYVAVLTLAFWVHFLVLVFALRGIRATTIPVVAVVAHALREVLQVRMMACIDLSRLAPALLPSFGLFNYRVFFVFALLRKCGRLTMGHLSLDFWSIIIYSGSQWLIKINKLMRY